MPQKDRRRSPRKHCMIPVRFQILANSYVGVAVAGAGVGNSQDWPEGTAGHFGSLDGEAINLSASGIGFKSRAKLEIGDRLEMYLTVPPSITGRSFEHMRCKAHIVRVDAKTDVRGLTSVGAVVEAFEPVASIVSQVRFG